MAISRPRRPRPGSRTRRSPVKVMAFGSFDVLHPGHLHFLKAAKTLGDILVVSVARDANVKKFKGRLPVFGENDRLGLVGSLKMVDRAVVGSSNNFLAHICAERPDIIALGYDQSAYVKELMEAVNAGELGRVKVARLKAYNPGKYKSSKYKSLIKKSKIKV